MPTKKELFFKFLEENTELISSHSSRELADIFNNALSKSELNSINGVISPRHARSVISLYTINLDDPSEDEGSLKATIKEDGYEFEDDRYLWSDPTNDEVSVSLSRTIVDEVFMWYHKELGNMSAEEVSHKYNLSLTDWHFLRYTLNISKKGAVASPETVKRYEDEHDLIDHVSAIFYSSKSQVDLVRNRIDKKVSRLTKRKYQELQNREVLLKTLTTNVIEGVSMLNTDYEIPKIEIVPSLKDEVAAIAAPYDTHFGKSGWKFSVGQKGEYNRKIASERLLGSATNLIRRSSQFNVQEYIVPVGSDFLHIDNYHNSTTGMTRQDVDGDIYTIMNEGSHLMVQYIDMLRSHAPVKLLFCKGNHDTVSGFALMLFLQAWYRDTKDVEVILEDARSYQYYMYGNTLMGFTHGDGAKSKDLKKIMSEDEKKRWGMSEYTMWFTGHLHSDKVTEDFGTHLIQLRCLSGSDRWHEQKGYYFANKGMANYIIHPEEGWIHTVLSNIR